MGTLGLKTLFFFERTHPQSLALETGAQGTVVLLISRLMEADIRDIDG